MPAPGGSGPRRVPAPGGSGPRWVPAPGGEGLVPGGCLLQGGLVSGGCLLKGVLKPPPVTATAAGSTHPTGMHSCSNSIQFVTCHLKSVYKLHFPPPKNVF